MEELVKVVSYNCRGLPKSPSKLWEKPSVNLLLQDLENDIICFQETFYSKQDLGCLNTLHSEFQGIGVSTTDASDKLISTHPPGGVAIMYRVKHAKCISPIYFNLDWVVGISINIDNKIHVILCVYMKTASGGRGDHNEIFQGQLEELKLIINDLNTSSVTIIGDFNADLTKPTHPHGPLLRQFSNENGIIISSEQLLPDNSFTYVSEMRIGETSWLDHCISTQDGHNIISDMYIEYSLVCRDHIPLVIKLSLDKLPAVVDDENDVSPRLNWDSFDVIKLRQYYLMSDIYLNKLIIPVDALNCRNVNCKNKGHISQIKQFYVNICKCLTDASSTVFGELSKRTFNCRPGFNEHVKELHEIARKRFVAWREANKPRDTNNPFFREMNRSRAKFKLALRYIKRHENQMRQDAIADALCDNSDGNFWKEIKKLSPNNMPLPVNIDDATGKSEVVELWLNHFKQLLNCVNGKDTKNLNYECKFDPNLIITPGQVEDAINNLDAGKSCGLDGIYSEHLKYSSLGYRILIAKCMTSFLVHGELPESLMSVVLVPIIKDKSGKINSKDNYRPIAIASIMSKLIEKLLLERLSDYLLTSPHQFGFKPKHSTDACIYVLKESIDRYLEQQSSVYLCFLDASKAFDRVNHFSLFNKLINRGVPGYLVRILVFWYSNQVMCVRWGTTMSKGFKVTNGVRQGGILSPYLFNLYLDDLSVILRKQYAGCKIANQIINHLLYADDLVLMCPSFSGLQDLLDICGNYAEKHDIKFNTKKSVVLVRRNKQMKNAVIPKFKLCQELLTEVQEVKYLGHIITDDGKDDKDILNACGKLYAQGNSLLRKFHMCTEKVKIKLFVTYCSQFYCAHLWKFNKSDKKYNKLRVAYNNVFRFLLSLPRDEEGRPCSASNMFVTRKVKSFDEILRNLVFKFQSRLKSSNNELVCSTINKIYNNNSKLSNHWQRLLMVGIT